MEYLESRLGGNAWACHFLRWQPVSGTQTRLMSTEPEGRSKSRDSKDKEEEPVRVDACGDINEFDSDDEEDMEEMYVMGPAGMEWGGPTRGGRHPEPTRFGDWERKGRCSDF